jgi:hypothetical protein
MPRVKALSPFEAKRTLVNRFGPRVDRLRQIATNFGLRPYRIWLVWDRYTGGEAGVGDCIEAMRIELIPTPVVKSMDGTMLQLMNAGMVPEGSVRITKISPRYTYDQLRGLWYPARHEDALPEGTPFFYEVVEDGRGDSTPVRHRFRLLGLPHRDAGKLQWSLTLERVSGDNARDGDSTYT